MIKKIYYFLHDAFSAPAERGECSAGRWQGGVRQEALRLCAGACSLLEVGCGEGLFLEKAAHLKPNMRLAGVDMSPKLLARASTRAPSAQMIQADARCLPFGDAAFDTVICINVLMAFNKQADIIAVIRELIRVCAPGGKIIFDIRNASNVLLRLKYALAPYYDGTIRHGDVNAHTLQHVFQWLESVGWRAHTIRSVGFCAGIRSCAPVFVIEARRRIP